MVLGNAGMRGGIRFRPLPHPQAALVSSPPPSGAAQVLLARAAGRSELDLQNAVASILKAGSQNFRPFLGQNPAASLCAKCESKPQTRAIQPPKMFDSRIKGDYCCDRKAMMDIQTKRIADILEKFGVGSLLVGLYQQKWVAILLGCASLYGCLILNRRLS